MDALIHEIRQIARDLLERNEVEQVIGFERGTMAMRSRPCIVKDADDADRLIWDGFCQNNLAVYLRNIKGRTAVIAKGCDSRAIVELIKENQIARERLVIIGVPCEGMVDRALIESELGPGEVEDVIFKHGEMKVNGAEFEKRFNRKDILHHSCKTCTHPAPVISDRLVGSPVPSPPDDTFEDIAAFEALSPDERWDYFNGEMQKCIRCYACRNACPLCYCKECFVDATRPQWIGKSVDLSDTALFHLMRGFHLAGRCVQCGACERACPMGVDIGKLNRKFAKDVLENFSYQSGMSLDTTAPLSTYRPDDPEQFIFEP